jgi:hypothetical protein
MFRFQTAHAISALATMTGCAELTGIRGPEFAKPDGAEKALLLPDAERDKEIGQLVQGHAPGAVVQGSLQRGRRPTLPVEPDRCTKLVVTLDPKAKLSSLAARQGLDFVGGYTGVVARTGEGSFGEGSSTSTKVIEPSTDGETRTVGRGAVIDIGCDATRSGRAFVRVGAHGCRQSCELDEEIDLGNGAFQVQIFGRPMTAEELARHTALRAEQRREARQDKAEACGRCQRERNACVSRGARSQTATKTERCNEEFERCMWPADTSCDAP